MRTFRLLLWLPLLTGCLHPLPRAELLPCRSDRLPEFWKCLDETKPSRTGCDPQNDAGCFRRESAFRSTTRIHFQDVVTLRKWREQRPASACSLESSPGFQRRNVTVDGRTTYGFVFPAAGIRPYVLISYGLYDSSTSRYVRVIANLLAAEGFGVVIPDMPWHGCSLRDAPEFLATLGATESVALIAWARSIQSWYPGAHVALLGFSLGAQNLICALSSPEAQDLFDGGIAVSPPAELQQTISRLDTAGSFREDGMARLVRFFFRSNLAGRLRLIGLEPSAHPFAQYMDQVAAKQHRTAAEVIASIEPETRMAVIRRPLLLVVSTHDPVFPDSVPHSLEAATQGNRYAYVLELEFGGHIGHMAVAPKWFASLLDTFFSMSRSLQ